MKSAKSSAQQHFFFVLGKKKKKKRKSINKKDTVFSEGDSEKMKYTTDDHFKSYITQQ